MNILGIHDGHNATVALFKDNKIEYALSEERLSREKNQGGFPILALNRILSEARLSLGDIDKVVFCTKKKPQLEWYERKALLNRYSKSFGVRDRVFPDPLSFIKSKIIQVKEKLYIKFGNKDLRRLNEEDERFRPLLERGFSKNKIEVMDHHLCHAASAYFSQGNFSDEILCLTNDGGGDGICATVSICQNGRINRIASVAVGHSFAALYARTTFLMGMMPLEHEYKLMGLAPYGDKKKAEEFANKLLAYFEWDPVNPLSWKIKEGYPAAFNFGRELKKIFEFARFDVIAAAMQIFIEEMAIRWIKNCIAHTNIRRLALAGGLFMNVKLNKKILELPEVDSIYIMPSSGDESTPFGACYYKDIESGASLDKLEPLKTLYLGPSYSSQDIDEALEDFKFHNRIKVDKPHSIEEAVSDLLSKGEIVAFYHGREEFGARALGNRSILADPSDVNVIKIINKMIKSRDFWMPFAGTMTMRQAELNLNNPKKHFAPYMIMAFDVQANINDFKAAIHPYDETMRPQMLARDWNPIYYRIIELFEQKSQKKGGLLNTSFNLHGYPIVSSPRDALEALDKSGLKFLALGPYLVYKE